MPTFTDALSFISTCNFDVPHRRFHKGVVCPPEMLELG